MIVSYETSDHVTGRVLLPFKAPISEWQVGCAGPSAAVAPRDSE